MKELSANRKTPQGRHGVNIMGAGMREGGGAGVKLENPAYSFCVGWHLFC